MSYLQTGDNIVSKDYIQKVFCTSYREHKLFLFIRSKVIIIISNLIVLTTFSFLTFSLQKNMVSCHPHENVRNQRTTLTKLQTA